MSSSEEKEPYDIPSASTHKPSAPPHTPLPYLPSAPPPNFEKKHTKECIKDYLVKNKWMKNDEDLTIELAERLRTALQLSKALGEHPSKIPTILNNCKEKKRKEMFDKLLKRGGKTRGRRKKVKGTRKRKNTKRMSRKPRKGKNTRKKNSRKPRTSKKRGQLCISENDEFVSIRSRFFFASSFMSGESFVSGGSIGITNIANELIRVNILFREFGF